MEKQSDFERILKEHYKSAALNANTGPEFDEKIVTDATEAYRKMKNAYRPVGSWSTIMKTRTFKIAAVITVIAAGVFSLTLFDKPCIAQKEQALTGKVLRHNHIFLKKSEND